MKKITFFNFLFFTFLSVSFVNAQSVVFSDDFNDSDISDWTVIDADGDGFNWSVVQIQDDAGIPVGTPQLRSASWVSTVGALTPNNYIVAPVIDLSSASGAISLDWQVKASDADYDAENYSVYVSTGNTVADFLASNTSFDETTLDGVNQLSDRTLNISAFAGEATVYVAFRHYNVSDEFTMEIDNVSVSAATLSVDEFSETNFKHVYNKNSDLLTLNSMTSPLSSLEIYSVLGQRVLSKELSNTNESLNLSSLQDGVYIIKVEIEGKSKTFKLLKQ